MKQGISFALLVSFLVSHVALAGDYHYVSYSVGDDYHGGKDSLSMDVTRGVLYADHGTQRINFCGQDDPYYCFAGNSLNFAVPKRGKLSLGEQWESQGKKFKVVRADVIEMLGVSVPVVLISSDVSESRTDYFYYSLSRGLMGIKLTQAGEPVRFLVSKGRLGFPK